MKSVIVLVIFFILNGLLLSCHRSIVKSTGYKIATVNNNICKKLSGRVVLYAVFVDTKYSFPWSSYDINSTLDSIKKAAGWIEKTAAENGIPLNIDIRYHQNKQTIPIVNNFPNKTLAGTLFSPTPMIGIKKIDRWADKIAKVAGLSLPPDTSSATKTKNSLKDRERLIARLRDLYQTDNVALLYFINNYYTDEISVVLHSGSDDHAEYGIVSFKNPSVITHEFLHLFGALDLYVSPFDRKRALRRKKELAMKEFPNEIMAFTHRKLDSLEISPFTKYLIGWDNELDEKYRRMLLGRKVKVLKY